MLHDYTNENKKSSQAKHKRYEIETKSNPRRAQGGKGLLSHQSQYKILTNSWLKSLVLERRGREKGQGGEGRPGREAALFLRKGQREKRERERKRGGEGVFNPNNSLPKRLNYP